MYTILSQGEILDYVEKPNYVTLNTDNGVPKSVPQWEADALSVRGVHYNLPGSDKIKWTVAPDGYDDEGNPISPLEEVVAPEAVAVEKAVAELIFNQKNKIEELTDTTNTLTETASAYEDMLLELDAFYGEQIAALMEGANAND